MGNQNKREITYKLRIIFYGDIPREIIQRVNNNREIRFFNNYYYYKRYDWYIYFTMNNANISAITDIINYRAPNENGLTFQKNVIISFLELNRTINLLQFYQEQFANGLQEDDIPYFIFDRPRLEQNNQILWDLQIRYIEDKDIINISALNENLNFYQTDFKLTDFLLCRIFRDYDNLENIYDKLQELKDNNEYEININPNTEKLELLFHINNNDFNNQDVEKLNVSKETSDELFSDLEDSKKYKRKNKKMKKNIYKTNIKIKETGDDAILIIEQNIFIHISIINILENQRSLINSLIDAANYFNYLPISINEDKNSYTSFNIMLVGETQSGKSVLVNKIAGKNITRSSKGALRTEDIFLCEINNGNINLYDTCGVSRENRPREIYSKLMEK